MQAINKAPVFEKVLIAVLMISYIQAFEYGNKRTGIILENAILFANTLIVHYNKEVLIRLNTKSDNNVLGTKQLFFLKEIFVDQFTQVIKKYF